MNLKSWYTNLQQKVSTGAGALQITQDKNKTDKRTSNN